MGFSFGFVLFLGLFLFFLFLFFIFYFFVVVVVVVLFLDWLVVVFGDVFLLLLSLLFVCLVSTHIKRAFCFVFGKVMPVSIKQ